jgi:hypothetical protein
MPFDTTFRIDFERESFALWLPVLTGIYRRSEADTIAISIDTGPAAL